MTQAELILAYVAKHGVSLAEAKRVMASVLDLCFEQAVANGKVVFGKHRFERKDRAPRKGRNPATGETIDISAKTKVSYRNTGL